MAEMTEPGELSLPPSADPMEPTPEPQPPPEPGRDRRATLALVLAVISLLAVALAGFSLLRNGRVLTQRVQAVEQAQQASDPAKLTQLDEQVTALRDTVAKLQARPEPAPPPPAQQVDLKPLEDRLAALEQRPAATVPDQSALTGKLQGLLGQLDSLTQQVQAAKTAATTAQAAARTAQEQADTAQQQAKAAQSEAKTAQGEARTAQGEAKTAQGQASSAQAQTSAATDRAGQSQRLQAAATALDAGHPLGEIASAPPALTRFATAPPPTEASLRLAYPPLAKRAAEASRPSLEGESLVQRMWTRAQALVTVKQGDRVLVGAPATTTLAQAQQLLDAGDLPGALHALGALDPAAAQVMAPWREQAQSLVEARAALAAAVSALAQR